jgi:hypothetical protein
MTYDLSQSRLGITWYFTYLKVHVMQVTIFVTLGILAELLIRLKHRNGTWLDCLIAIFLVLLGPIIYFSFICYFGNCSIYLFLTNFPFWFGMLIGFLILLVAIPKILLTPISEENLIIPTLIVWYMVLTINWNSYFNVEGEWGVHHMVGTVFFVLSILFLIPFTVITLMHLISYSSLKSPSTRASLYAWYLFCLFLTTMIFWGKYGYIGLMLDNQKLPPWPMNLSILLDAFLLGMISLKGIYGFIFYFYAFSITPGSDKNIKDSDPLNLNDYFTDRQLPLWLSLFLISLNIGIFYFHYKTQLVSDITFVCLLLLIESSFLRNISIRRDKKSIHEV